MKALAAVPVVLLPTQVKPVRDINYCTVEEAQAVCASLLATEEKMVNLKIVQAEGNEIGGAANIYPDGRLALKIQFSVVMNELVSTGRIMAVTVPFDEVAGELLQFIENVDEGDWEFLAESNGDDTFTGDVEK